MRPTDRRVDINISAVPVNGVGGLGLVALALLVTIIVPDVWWVLLIAASGGLALGAILIIDSRHTILTGRTRDITTLRTGPGTSRLPD